MKSRILGWALCLALVAPAAQAQQTSGAAAARGQGWSFLGSQTVGNGRTALAAEVGFPGLTLSVLRGLHSGVDLGGRLSLVYAYESIPTLMYPGLKGDVIARFSLLDAGRFSLAATAGLGFLTTFSPGLTVAGISVPVGVVLGIPIGSALIASVGLELPFFVTFGSFGGPTLPILGGLGVEYFLDKTLALTLNTRMGPALNVTALRAGTTEFAFEAQLGIALRM